MARDAGTSRRTSPARLARGGAARRISARLQAFAPLMAAGALGVVTLGVGLGFAVAMARPDLDLGPASNLLAVQEARAEAALAVGDLDASAASTQAALAEAPLTSHAWARQAMLAYRREGRLGPDTVEALQRSYAVAPYGPEITVWRLSLLLEHWSELPPDLRRAGVDELRVFTSQRPDRARDLGDDVQSPEGRLALMAAIRLSRLEARRAAAE